ncbi:hypothetical protein JR316_0008734 [Psilocybe cubensis]|uniref:Uncharacterized protein n=1 Tax=Psilocybe cubensis TaxID=181762 RepID=A0ACB8GRI7_PSICU|nr:hypothetical protein JR316_0008734 [Psilocybe cubensis]KAH9478281.1 hypothetical protein JR316_0008734 [Psilocybe cubensis]
MTKTSRKSKKKILYEDDADAADIITYETQTRTTRTGRKVNELVEVPLTIAERYHVQEGQLPSVSVDDDGDDTQRDYILQFVERVDDLLGALLSREALKVPVEQSICTHCEANNIATWRCRDCSLPVVMCRKCMRESHKSNPMHRIEQWIGTHFRSAELWEVGMYLLIPHHSGEAICPSLKARIQFLEYLEEPKDRSEQAQLRTVDLSQAPWRSEEQTPTGGENSDNPLDNVEPEAEPGNHGPSDAEFEQLLDGLLEDPSMELPPDVLDEDDEDTAVLNGDSNVRNIPQYLQYPTGPIPNASMHAGQVPTADGLNNSYVRVVHTNGLHHLAMVSCVCHGSNTLPLDLMASRLLPTSFYHTRTLFSAHLLDYFRLSNLELKASAYQFYSLLKRITNPMAPSSVVDLYNEFRRMSRLWRWMKRLKWAGFAGHNGKSALNVGKGELANYCPTCPQPGVNIDPNWKDDPNRWVYKRIFVADGNFKADHVRSEKPSRDIWLSEGGGMMPPREEYHEFLRTAIEALTGAPCENTFRAIQNSLLSSSSCDVTGIVGVACARHGCYAPNALVNLFKGEQQKNVDFAFLAALRSTGVHPDQGTMMIYDIICQYIIHLLKRIKHHLPDGFKIDRAIGMFHVHAHKDECFFRYAPTFIPGAACVCGEILESLWADLNSISPAARTATLAHRTEILDDHASDSNHKKALGITKYLCRRHLESVKARETYRISFSNLTKAADPDALKLWTKQIEDAEARRLEDATVMDIYAAKRPGRTSSTNQESDCSTESLTPIQSWIQFALLIEERQLDIRVRARRLVNHDRLTDRVKLQKLRDALKPLLSQLALLQANAGVVTTAVHGRGFSEQLFVDWEDDEDVLAPGSAPPVYEAIDKQILCLPSNGTADNVYVPYELQARILQARSLLNQLRERIAERSFQYSDVIRHAPRKGVRTRGYTAAKELRDQISLHAQAYSHCRSCLVQLGADESTLREFRVLTKEDVRSSTAVINPNIVGSTKFRLSWIWYSVNQRLGPRWTLDPNADTAADPYSIGEDADPATVLEFKRVHWLRARALYNRWLEEETLVRYEMSENTPTMRIFRQPSVLAMDKAPTIRPFRAFDLQYGANPQHHEFLQSVVFCAGSRFREALIHVLQSSGQRQKRWMQQALQRELNWVLRCIGRAYAIGFNIEIPLVIRCLADTLGSVSADHLPLDIDMSFAEFLASGTRDWAFDKRVESYSHDWWNRNSAPQPSEHLGTATVSEILTRHKAEFYKTFDPEPTTTFDELLKTHIGTGKVTNVPPNMPLIHPVQVILNNIGDTCNACDAFQNLSIESIQQLSSFKNHTSIMFSTADNTLDLISRRAIGFFELYEAAKRAADLTQGPDTMDSENPASKWTWGRQLTTKEVCLLGAGKKASHSGYAESLRDGKLPSRSVHEASHSAHASDTFESVPSVVMETHDSKDPIKHPQYFEDGTDTGSIASIIERAATTYESDSDDSDAGNAGIANNDAMAQAPQTVAELLAQAEYISSDDDDNEDMHGEEDGDKGKDTDTGLKRQNADNNGADRRTKPRRSDAPTVEDTDTSQMTAYFTKNFFSNQLDEGLFEMDAEEDEDADDVEDTDTDEDKDADTDEESVSEDRAMEE